MKKKILITVILSTFIITHTTCQEISATQYKNKIIHEDFNTGSEAFKIITTSDNYFIVDNGDYLLSRNNKKKEYAIIAKNSDVRNFVLKTSLRIGPSDNKNASIGVIIKAQDNGKGAIVFEINKKGEYRIKQLQDNEYIILSGNNRGNGWEKSNIIKKINEHNQIEIRSENNNYDIYTNNKFLTSFFISNYHSGSSGLIISPNTKARIAYFYLMTNDDNNKKPETTSINNVSNIKTENNEVITNLNQRIKELEAKIKLNSDLQQGYENQIKEIKTNNEQLNSDLLKGYEAKIEEIKANNTKAKNELEDNYKDKIRDIEEEKIIIKNNLEEKNQELGKLIDKNKELSDQKIKNLKSEINNLEMSQDNLNKLLTEDKAKFEKIRNSLSKEIKNGKEEIKSLKKTKQTIENEVTKLRKTQAKHNEVVNKINEDNKILENKLTLKKEENKLLDNNIKDLKEKNMGLKELFVLRDFQENNIVPAEERTKIITNTKSINKQEHVIDDIISEIKYTVKLGVFTNPHWLNDLEELEKVLRYTNLERNTHTYFSGEFNNIQEAKEYQEKLKNIGYKNTIIQTYPN